MTSVEVLPSAVLTYAFRFLTIADIFACGFVCKRWRAAACALLFPVLRVKNYERALAIGSLAVASNVRKFVTSVRFFECTVCDKVIGHLQKMSNVTELLFEDCTFPHIAALSSLTTVESLKIKWCNPVGDADMISLSEMFKLRKLKLAGCDALTDEGIAHLSILTNLQVLSLKYCSQLTDESVKSLTTLTALRRLKLDGWEELTDEGLTYLTTFTELKCLNFKYCDQITDHGLAIVRQLTSLRQLNLSSCDGITDDGVDMLTELTHLKQLFLGGCDQLTTTSLFTLASRLPKLRMLNLEDCPQITSRCLLSLKGQPEKPSQLVKKRKQAAITTPAAMLVGGRLKVVFSHESLWEDVEHD